MFSNKPKNLKKSNFPANFRELDINSHSINKDLMKSIITHGLMFIIVLGIGFIQNRKKFINIEGAGSKKQYHAFNEMKDNKPNNKQDIFHNQPIIKASLIDHKMVDEAIKIQEHQHAERIVKEKNIQQQEQRLAKLTKTLEQEVLKAKKDRENLKKEQEILQKEVIKFQNQSKELLQQQEKLKKKSLEQSNQQEKKINSVRNMQSLTNQSLNNDNSNSDENHAFEGKNVMFQSKLSNIYSRWHGDIVNNRKRTVFFPDNLICTIKIKVLSDGNLSYVKMEKSSGNKAYDYFSEQAIYKSAPFYMPEDPILIKELIETEHIFYFDDSAFS